jgi:adenosylcobinamide-phosphate synthase
MILTAGTPMPLLLALLLDVLLGDPPNRWHPVAWMGTMIGAVRGWTPKHGRWLPLAYGAGLALLGTALLLLIGSLLVRRVDSLPAPVGWLVEACLLKTTFSVRGLGRAASQVQQALENGDLARARCLVGWHLVSRDTSSLEPSQVAAAVVESVAENASDSIVAPLVYYTLGGLPAALAYRFVNTADAMIGYRDAKHLWLGKVPARLDDLANLVPARLTAMLIILTAPRVEGRTRQAWTVWRRDARRTASPNAGHPMSAMAGALGVELEKLAHYRLGSGNRVVASWDIRRAVRLVDAVTILIAGLLASLLWAAEVLHAS